MKGNMLYVKAINHSVRVSHLSDCSPRRSRMKESREELDSFWCVSVGLTVSLSFVLSSLCGLSFALYLLSGAGGVQWNWNTGKQGKKWEGWGGGEDEFPVCACASGVKSLAYLPPLFYFSFCDRCNIELNLCLIYRKYAKTELLC